ncbi:MAG: hypothetical protein PF549_04825 [Patescibacteria group bacterium]|jgi:peptidoglycan hydrolase CwlO-like protein|nr:hypothetical protein [Patescibacteria group bacterium]
MTFKNKTKKNLSASKKLLWLFVIGSFLLFGFFINNFVFAADEDTEEIKEKLEKVEEDLAEEQEKEKTIQSELEVIDKNIEVIQLQIQKTERLIKDFDQKINDKKEEIVEIENRMAGQREVLKDYVKLVRHGNDELDLILMNQEKSIGDYFKALDSFEILQSKIKGTLDDVKQDKINLEQEKNVLENNRTEQKKIQALQDDQRETLEYEEKKKNLFLQKTQEDINLLDIERSELRRQLNALQSLGEPISLEKAIDSAEYASKKTGVRTAFLLGVLRVESNLGQNVGGGTYKVDMNPNQRDTFKDICDDLGYKASKMPVSKRVCYNTNASDGCGGWGGAMGPAQFMPSTWMGYKDRVKKITGKTADPWNLEDALIAMGLKLSAVSGVTDHKRSAEKQAASMYLAGGNWEYYTWYGDRVLYYADGFEKYIAD